MLKAMYKLELISLFRTPFAWVLLGVGAALIAFQFLAQVELYLSIADKLRSVEQAPGATELIIVPTIISSHRQYDRRSDPSSIR